MILLGRHITNIQEKLRPISLERLFKGIKHSKERFVDRIEQLRTIAAIDPASYRQLKKELPYFVCGNFHPPFRRKENFSQIEYFVLDLDHLAQGGYQPSELRKLLQGQKKVFMVFLSPGGDGLKVLFKLDKPCRDAAMYSSFYKVFAGSFARNTGLESIVDYQTHDVTRACFISHDSEAWLNPEPVAVKMEDYLDIMDFDKAAKDIKAAELFTEKEKPPEKEKGPDETVLEKIKSKLHPGKKPKVKQYYVPEVVNSALEPIATALSKYDIEVKETAPIHYGRKIKVKAAHLWAEINVFYGKRGFSVVKTTKSGSNEELAGIATGIIEAILEKIKG